MKLPAARDRIFHGLAIARRFRADLVPHRRTALLVLAATGAAVLFEILRPWTIQWVIDHALLGREPAGVARALGEQSPWFYAWTGAAAYLALSLLRAGAEYLALMQQAAVTHALTRGLRERLFAHLLRLSPLFHASHKSGDLLVRLMGDASLVAKLLVEAPIELITRGLLIAGTLAMLLAIDARLALVVLASGPLLIWIVRFATTRLRVTVRKQRRKEGDLADSMYEGIVSVALIQSLGREKHVAHRFLRGNRSSARAGLKAARVSARLVGSVEIVLGLGVAGTLLLGSRHVLAGSISPGELIVILTYVRSLLKPVRQASRSSERFAKGSASGERLLQVLEETPAISSPPNAPEAPAAPITLEFEDVHFSYAGARRGAHGRQDALEGLSCRFRRGTLNGIFGRSGAGKTTIAALALRLFDPTRGRVLLDGTDLRKLELESLRGCFALCMQDTVLFGDTVRENLLFGVPEAADDELWAALEDAAAAEFVRDLPEGLDTVLGSSGDGLSGGQRRRLALARAFLRKAPILVLDEPFAGLDLPAEARVRRAISERAGQAIVLLISHDPALLEHCDNVVFLQDGRATAIGKHAHLERELPAYRLALAVDAEGQP